MLGQTESRVRDLPDDAARALCRRHKSKYDVASDFKELKRQMGILSGVQIGILTGITIS